MRRTPRKILLEIVNNGMQEYSKLAKKLRLAPSTVKYTVDRLIENNVIRGFRIRLNPFSLNLGLGAVFIIDIEDSWYAIDILEKLKNIPNLFKSFIVTGEPAIISIGLFSDAEQVKKTMTDIKSILKPHGRFSIIPCLDIIKLHHQIIRRKERMRFSNREMEILNEILRDPLASKKRISEKLGFSRVTVSKTISRFMNKQLILKKSTMISQKTQEELGIGTWVVTFFNLGENGSFESIAKYSSVHELFVLGSWMDGLAIIREKSLSEVAKFLTELSNQRIIKKTVSYGILYFHEPPDLAERMLISSYLL